MPATCVFVSYAITGDERGAEVARQFIKDLQANHAEVITDQRAIPDGDFIRYLNQELPRCQYLVLIQTPLALESLRVQTAITIALNMVAQQQMRGVLRMIAAPARSGESDQPIWITPRSFDATRDYPRARDKMLLELNLLTFEEDTQKIPVISVPHTPLTRALHASFTGPLGMYSEPRLPVTNLPGVSPAFSDFQVHQPEQFPLDAQPGLPQIQAQKYKTASSRASSKKRLWLLTISLLLIIALATTIGSAVAHSQSHKNTRSANPTLSAQLSLTKTPPPAASPTATPTPGGEIGRVTLPTPTPRPVVTIDNLNNTDLLSSKTANLDLDQDNSQHLHGDTSTLVRADTNVATAAWKMNGLTAFQAIIYFWPPQDMSPLSDLAISTSTDGVHWTAVTPTLTSSLSNTGDIWSIYTYNLNQLSQVNFVEIRWLATSDEYWGQQVGQVTLTH